ncbi:PP2C family serine/threonine-protein phosphatase [Chitinophaga sp. Ak27]|uniref:PP2C family serine/threonine-protein phosphatase n=1 Tax=Chitinophaga sp. Ak27 TaxID=2726116 RepID=UPI00145F73A9|nr:PP2C family serine/threonine-protein phosphatase [Chitinophaga sp. Ak27]NLU93391.1 protein phosphatase 2C domain-containing protein [Chitinophaga sp. Ak27]
MGKSFIRELFQAQQIDISNREQLFEAFVQEEENLHRVKQILENQQFLMDRWQLKSRLADIQQQTVVIPNATMGKIYEARLDFQQLNWTDFTTFTITGLDAVGLQFDSATSVISGTPTQNGDWRIKLSYRLQGESEETPLHEKLVPLIINPDPRSLWKNISSDSTAPFWREDNVATSAVLGDKRLVVASRRGRSHANTGGFRDDDFAFRHFPDTGWTVLAVSDGAGSAPLAREGARMACAHIVAYFEQHFTNAALAPFDTLLAEHAANPSEKTEKQLTRFVYDQLGKAAFTTHKKIAEFAHSQQVPVKDFHATLIFALLKKYPCGYVIMSFGVGDCPIGLLNKDLSAITLMNRLDVGEFGGGTRFITMPEIFKSDTFATRFGFKLVPDFSYLMLMTDGIYDPKFEVEANLEKVSAWKALLADLGGDNKENAIVELDTYPPAVAQQLSDWMDFWSPGNHDDRTLMIIS